MHCHKLATIRRFNHLHEKVRLVMRNALRHLNGRWYSLRMSYGHAGLFDLVQEAGVAVHTFLKARDAACDAD